MISNRRLYTDRSRRLILEEGDPRIAYLLVGANCSYNKVSVLGLNVDAYLRAHPTRPTANENDEQPNQGNDEMPQTKSMNAPPKTKAMQPDKTKGK